jgi:hypothetical protein
MVTLIRRVDEILALAVKGEDVTKPLAEFRDQMKSIRKQWWADSTGMFNSLCGILDSFYAQAWNSEFKATEKKQKARNHYANLILDQIYHSNGGAFRRGEDDILEFSMHPTTDLDAVPGVVTIDFGGTKIRLVDVEQTKWCSVRKDELEELKEKAWKYDELGR